MRYLNARGLDKVITSLKQPVFGICLGLQLLCHSSEEGNAQCLGLIPLQVKKIKDAPKLPHVGWNTLHNTRGPLFKSVDEGSYVYFVHSFAAEQGEATCATTEYGTSFTAALSKDNFFAVQFHPERSGEVGETILKNFLAL